jgi:hypothetical protein
MPNTNVTGLPRTGLADTNVIRMTKKAVQTALTDPILLQFMKNDQSFNRELTMSFERGAVANVQVAPKLTAAISSDVSDTVDFQDGSFSQVPVSLDYIANVGWTNRQIQNAISDLDVAMELGESAGIALIEAMYERVISMFVNNSYVGADQKLGSVGTPINEEVLGRIRTVMELQHGVSRNQIINLIVNPYAYEVLSQLPRFTQADTIGDGNTIRSGILSTVHGIKIYSDRAFADNGGNSQSVSGSQGAIGVAFTDEAFVLPTRRLGIMNPALQYEVNLQGIAALYSSDYTNNTVGGLVAKNKMEILFGLQALAKRRKDTGAINGTIYPILGGL